MNHLLHSLPLCTDPTLTINNLHLVTASVKKWYELGPYVGGLGVPRAVCNDIRDSTVYKSEEDKKNALLVYYRDTVAMASWQHVAGALHYREEKTALEAVKVFLKSTPAGESIFQWTCVQLCSLSLSMCVSPVCSQNPPSLQTTCQQYWPSIGMVCGSCLVIM